MAITDQRTWILQLMICLAYFSSAVVPMTSTELSGIVAQAQRNNSARGITGMLCHYDGSLLQFLEGPDQEVDETFAKISRDPRHHQVLKVFRRPIDERIFADWSMAVVKLDEISPAQQAFCKSLRQVEIEVDAEHRPQLEGFLQSFRAWMR